MLYAADTRFEESHVAPDLLLQKINSRIPCREVQHDNEKNGLPRLLHTDTESPLSPSQRHATIIPLRLALVSNVYLISL